MLRTRILVSLAALPVLTAVIVIGDPLYQVTVAVLLGLGAWELNRLMQAGGYAPSLVVSWLVIGVCLLAVTRPDVLGPGVTLAILLALGMMLARFRAGAQSPLNEFALTVGIGLYLGWLGASLIQIRLLPDGLWWTLTVLPIVFAADTGAFAAGRTWGRHTLAPWVSPHKTWEGYLGGVVWAMGFGLLATLLWQIRAPAVQPVHGLLLGLILGVCAPMGDLAVSAFKRQVGAKEASGLIPGHGGFMDRLDTVLIAAALAYYYLLWFA
jgi:phosphatidate cytidylyltransferase